VVTTPAALYHGSKFGVSERLGLPSGSDGRRSFTQVPPQAWKGCAQSPGKFSLRMAKSCFDGSRSPSPARRRRSYHAVPLCTTLARSSQEGGKPLSAWLGSVRRVLSRSPYPQPAAPSNCLPLSRQESCQPPVAETIKDSENPTPSKNGAAVQYCSLLCPLPSDHP
jgi:hypothetical protein